MKPIKPYWFLQQLVDASVGHLARDCQVTPVVMYDDDQIEWDRERDGIGRVRWYVSYIWPNESTRELKPIFDAAVSPWRRRYDLGLTCEPSSRAA
jgi:hypothetical protein